MGRLTSDISLSRANQIAEQHIREARDAIDPSLTLVDPRIESAGPCYTDDLHGGTDPERRAVAYSYRLAGVHKQKFSEYFGKLSRWWSQHGFQILQQEKDYLWAENSDDYFRLSFQTNDLGEAYLNLSSPCVPADKKSDSTN